MSDGVPAFISLTYTASADATFKLVYGDMWMAYADIFVTTNPAYLGNKAEQNSPLFPGDVYTVPGGVPVNLNDLFFKNYTGGSNTVINIIGVTLTRAKALEWGIMLPP